MTLIDIIAVLAIGFFVFLCIYAIVDRVCKYKEKKEINEQVAGMFSSYLIGMSDVRVEKPDEDE